VFVSDEVLKPTRPARAATLSKMLYNEQESILQF